MEAHMKTHLRLSALVAVACSLFAQLAQSGELTVTLTDIRSDRGQLMVAVANSDAAWNNQEKPVAAQKVAATGKDLVLRFNLPAGMYAVQVMHDENGNNKLDSNFMGIPIEGYGFSNNPGVLRKARFEEARFEIGDAPASIVVRLR
jgi:uncharacterized protein (DUF2141 family)